MASISLPTVGLAAAGIGAGGAIGSALLTSNASQSAANTQSNAAQQVARSQLQAAQTAANTQLNIYGQTKDTLAPFVSAGTSALTQLQNLLGIGSGGSSSILPTLQNLPGYQFSQQQGQQALDRSAASQGLLLSGGQLKAAQQYGQNLAQTQYNNYLSPLLGIFGTGESAGAQQGGLGTQTGNFVGQSLIGGANNAASTQLAAAQAAAQGTVGSSNALASGLFGPNNSLFTNLGTYFANNQGGGIPSSIPVTPEIGGSNPGGYFGLSDARAKTDIKRIGQTDSGLSVYSYRFKGSPLTQFGVIAQEVERVAPHAVLTLPSGLKAVDYKAVSELSKLKRAA